MMNKALVSCFDYKNSGFRSSHHTCKENNLREQFLLTFPHIQHIMKLLNLLFVAFTLSGISSAIPTPEADKLEPITGTIISTGVTEKGEPYTITADFIELTDEKCKLPVTCFAKTEARVIPSSQS
jgi:hypothetical protein